MSKVQDTLPYLLLPAVCTGRNSREQLRSPSFDSDHQIHAAHPRTLGLAERPRVCCVSARDGEPERPRREARGAMGGGTQALPKEWISGASRLIIALASGQPGEHDKAAVGRCVSAAYGGVLLQHLSAAQHISPHGVWIQAPRFVGA